jgi:hypothetical protein
MVLPRPGDRLFRVRISDMVEDVYYPYVVGLDA